ncbi:ABC transporter permease [Marinovum sp. 2_MG-2023]|uniref:ABC transporter permease n=1 Tax=unclassified Marinovum TaxID=2647166 RepID=UPI0026E47FA6|nr:MULTISPECIES: ABC transporter permease [unclassified Marinovum]MDO6732261.1 ABC transporter permease [Marinovum sp. 2_MG-2023]MDO6781578.1 ABC transporter permease [Marinovum sp. 1_MG-2023]
MQDNILTSGPDLAEATATAPAPGITTAPESPMRLIWRRFRRRRPALFGAAIVLGLAIVAIFAEFFAPYDPAKRDSAHFYMPPQIPHFLSAEDGLHLVPFVHPYVETFDNETFETTFAADTSRLCQFRFLGKGWNYSMLGMQFDRHLLAPDPACPMHVLGTDSLGRDMLSRTLIGARLTLAMAALVVTASVFIGTAIGLMSGFFSGWVDNVLQRITEFVLALPELPFYLALVAILPRNAGPYTVFFLLALILSLLKWAGLSREVRGKTLALRRVDYVMAAVALGARDRRILVKHLLPNILSHVIVVVTLMIPQIILVESFLSFLGIGVQPPLVSWGLLLNAAKDLQNLGSYPWMLLPVSAILVSVLGFNLLGDGLRDAIDPYSN